MIILMAFLTAFVVDNAEFLNTAKQQQAEGYRWTHVGKSTPSGTPAITINSNGNEFILWRLER